MSLKEAVEQSKEAEQSKGAEKSKKAEKKNTTGQKNANGQKKKAEQKKPTVNKKQAKKGNANVIENDPIKSRINNRILQFQGKFKQAKVHTINKIVHKLKEPEKLSKKVKNPEAKIERYQNVLNYLKHTSPKRLGLLALHYYKSGKNYLADPASTVEQLSVGYYCESKSLIAVLDMIREKLRIGDGNKWKRSSRKLFIKREKKEEGVEKQDKKKSDNDAASFVETDNDIESKPQKKSTEATSKKQKNGKKVKFNEDEDVEESVVDAPTTVDDFFITAEGTNYMSNAVNATQKDEDDNGPTKHEFGKRDKSESFIRNDAAKKFEKNGKRFGGEKRKWNEESIPPTVVKEEKKIDPNLHPSWIAKQKQKPTITEFKGSKITFD